jgi:hypothetical protein
MGWWILVNFIPRLKTYSGFHDLFFNYTIPSEQYQMRSKNHKDRMTQGNLFFNKKKKIFSVQSPGVNRV